MQLPSGDRFDYGLPSYLEGGVVNLLNALNVPAIVNGALVDNAGNTVGGIVTQTTREADFTLVAADSGTIIPVTGAVTVTVNAATDLTSPVEIRRYDAATLSITQSGVTAINPATGAAWGPLQVGNKLASIIIYPGSVADEYGAVKVGA